MKKVNITHLEELASTNKWMQANAAHFAHDEITAVHVDRQPEGYGRFGRLWQAGSGGNLAGSFFFHIPKGANYLLNIAQVVSLRFALILEEKGIESKLKWPNDLFLKDRKFGGVLVESVDMCEDIGVIVGIGVNVNCSKEELDSVGQPATSLLIESGRSWDVGALFLELVTHFSSDLEALASRGFQTYSKLFQERLLGVGKPATFYDSKVIWTGKIVGITDTGLLEMELENGQVKTFSSGELSSKSNSI